MRVVEVGADLSEGATQARWGRAEVLIKTSDAHPNVVVNEFIAGRLALMLGLPVAMGDVGDLDGRPVWVAGALRVAGHELAPPASSDLLKIPEDLRADVLVFDSLVNNVDRHDGNVIYYAETELVLIDHDQALFGDIRGDRKSGLASTAARRLSADHLFAERLLRPSPQAIDAAIRRVQAFNLVALDPHMARARQARLISKQEGEAVLAFLSDRQANIRRLLPPVQGQGPGVDLDALRGTLFDEGGSP